MAAKYLLQTAAADGKWGVALRCDKPDLLDVNRERLEQLGFTKNPKGTYVIAGISENSDGTINLPDPVRQLLADNGGTSFANDVKLAPWVDVVGMPLRFIAARRDASSRPFVMIHDGGSAAALYAHELREAGFRISSKGQVLLCHPEGRGYNSHAEMVEHLNQAARSFLQFLGKNPSHVVSRLRNLDEINNQAVPVGTPQSFEIPAFEPENTLTASIDQATSAVPVTPAPEQRTEPESVDSMEVLSTENTPPSKPPAGIELPGLSRFRDAAKACIGDAGTALIKNNWNVSIGGFPPVLVTLTSGRVTEICTYVSDTDVTGFEPREVFRFNDREELIQASSNLPMIGNTLLPADVAAREFLAISKYCSDAISDARLVPVSAGMDEGQELLEVYKNAHNPNLVVDAAMGAAADSALEGIEGLKTAAELVSDAKPASVADAARSIVMGVNLIGEEVLSDSRGKHYVEVGDERIYSSPDVPEKSQSDQVRFLSITKDHVNPVVVAMISAGFEHAGDSEALKNLFDLNELPIDAVRAVNAGCDFADANRDVWTTVVPNGVGIDQAYENAKEAYNEFIASLVMTNGEEYVTAKYGRSTLTEEGILRAERSATKLPGVNNSPSSAPDSGAPKTASPVMSDVAARVKEIFEYEQSHLKNMRGVDTTTTLPDVFEIVSSNAGLEDARLELYPDLFAYLERGELLGWYPLTQEDQLEFIKESAHHAPSRATVKNTDTKPVVPSTPAAPKPVTRKENLVSEALASAMARAGYSLATEDDLSLIGDSAGTVAAKAASADAVFVACKNACQTLYSNKGERCIVLANNVDAFENDEVPGNAAFQWIGAILETGDIIFTGGNSYFYQDSADMLDGPNGMIRNHLLADSRQGVGVPATLQNPLPLNLSPEVYARFKAGEDVFSELQKTVLEGIQGEFSELPDGAVRAFYLTPPNDEQKPIPAVAVKVGGVFKAFVGVSAEPNLVFSRIKVATLAEHAKDGTGYFASIEKGFTPGSQWRPAPGESAKIVSVAIDGRVLVERNSADITDEVKFYQPTDALLQSFGTKYYDSELESEISDDIERINRSGDQLLDAESAEQSRSASGTGSRSSAGTGAGGRAEDASDVRRTASKPDESDRSAVPSEAQIYPTSSGADTDGTGSSGPVRELRRLKPEDYNYSFHAVEKEDSDRTFADLELYTQVVGTARVLNEIHQLRCDPATGDVVLCTGREKQIQLLGFNAKGKRIYSDSNGVRKYEESGVLVTEKVGISPTGQMSIGALSKDYIVASPVTIDMVSNVWLSDKPSATEAELEAECFQDVVGPRLNEIRESVISFAESASGATLFSAMADGQDAQGFIHKQFTLKLPELRDDAYRDNSLLKNYLQTPSGFSKQAVLLPVTTEATIEDHVMAKVSENVRGEHKARFSGNQQGFDYTDILEGFQALTERMGNPLQVASTVIPHSMFLLADDWLKAVEAGQTPEEPVIRITASRGIDVGILDVNVLSGRAELIKHWQKGESIPADAPAASIVLRDSEWPPEKVGLGLLTKEALHENDPSINCMFNHEYGDRLYKQYEKRVTAKESEQEVEQSRDDASFFSEGPGDQPKMAATDTTAPVIEGDLFSSELMAETEPAAEELELPAGLDDAIKVLGSVERHQQSPLTGIFEGAYSFDNVITVAAKVAGIDDQNKDKFQRLAADVYSETLNGSLPIPVVDEGAAHWLEKVLPIAVSKPISTGFWKEAIDQTLSMYRGSFATIDNPFRKHLAECVTEISTHLETLAEEAIDAGPEAIAQLSSDIEAVRLAMPAVRESYLGFSELPKLELADAILSKGFGRDVLAGSRKVYEKLQLDAPLSFQEYNSFLEEHGESVGLATSISSEALNEQIIENAASIIANAKQELERQTPSLTLADTVTLGHGGREMKLRSTLVKSINQLLEVGGATVEHAEDGVLDIRFYDPEYDANGGYQTVQIGIATSGALEYYRCYNMSGPGRTDGYEVDFDFASGRGIIYSSQFDLNAESETVKINLNNFGEYLSMGCYAIKAPFLEADRVYTGSTKKPFADLPETKPALLDWKGKGTAFLGNALIQFANSAAREPEPVMVYNNNGSLVEKNLLQVGVHSIEVSHFSGSQVLSHKTAFELSDHEASELSSQLLVQIPRLALPPVNKRNVYDLGVFDDPNVYMVRMRLGQQGRAGVGSVMVNYDETTFAGSAPGDIFSSSQWPGGQAVQYGMITANQPLLIQADRSGLVSYEHLRGLLEVDGVLSDRSLPEMLGVDTSTPGATVNLNAVYSNPELHSALIVAGFDSVVLSIENEHGPQIQFVALDDRALAVFPRDKTASLSATERLSGPDINALAQAIVDRMDDRELSVCFEYLVGELHSRDISPAAYWNSQALIERLDSFAKVKSFRKLSEELGYDRPESMWVAYSISQGATFGEIVRTVVGTGMDRPYAEDLIESAYLSGAIGRGESREDVFEKGNDFKRLSSLITNQQHEQFRVRIPDEVRAEMPMLIGRYNPQFSPDLESTSAPEGLLNHFMEVASGITVSSNPLGQIGATRLAKPVAPDAIEAEAAEGGVSTASGTGDVDSEAQPSPIAEIASTIDQSVESPSAPKVNYDHQLYLDVLDQIREDLSSEMSEREAGDVVSQIVRYHEAFPQAAEKFVEKVAQFDTLAVTDAGNAGGCYGDAGFVRNTAVAAISYGAVVSGDETFADLLQLSLSQWALDQTAFIEGIRQPGFGASVNSKHWLRVKAHLASHVLSELLSNGLIQQDDLVGKSVVISDDYNQTLTDLMGFYEDMDLTHLESGTGAVMFGKNPRGLIGYCVRLDSPEKVTAGVIRDIREAAEDEFTAGRFMPDMTTDLLVAFGSALERDSGVAFNVDKAVELAHASTPAAESTVNAESSASVPGSDAEVVVGAEKPQAENRAAELFDQPAEVLTDELVETSVSAADVEDELLALKSSERALFERNIAAISVMKELNTGVVKRAPSLQEKKTLMGYAGWGALSKAFRQPDGSFADGWEDSALQLESLLTEEELRGARASTNSAFFTNPSIVKAMYAGLERLGVSDSQTWCEPSVGAGAFFGMMPESMSRNARRIGIEKDALTAGITRAIYETVDNFDDGAETRIIHSGFEKVHFSPGEIDVSISNPPFGQMRLHDAVNQKFNNMSIHNYFTCRSIESLRPGGVKALVVSRYLMDAKDSRPREKMAQMAELIGGFRLPESAFDEAGTKVVTDVLFFQRREQDLDLEVDDMPAWVHTTDVNVPHANGNGSVRVPVNSYFASNPDHVLGESVVKSGAFREALTVVEQEGRGWNQLLLERMGNLPAGIYLNSSAERRLQFKSENKFGEPLVVGMDVPGKALLIGAGTLFLHDSYGVMRKEVDYRGEPAAAVVQNKVLSNGTVKPLKGTDLDRITAMVEIREQADKLIRIEQQVDRDSDEPSAERAKLNALYDAFVGRFGFLNNRTNSGVMRQDSAWGRISALEHYSPAVGKAEAEKLGTQTVPETAEKAALFEKRLSYPVEEVTHADSLQDALVLSIMQRGSVNVPYIAELNGCTTDDVINGLEGEIFYNPQSELWEHKDVYLAGNVKAKFRAAEQYLDTMPRMSSNMMHLQASFPPEIAPEQVSVSFGAHWVPSSYYERFIDQLSGSPVDAEAIYVAASGEWVFRFNETGPMNDMLKCGQLGPKRILGKIASNAPIKVTTTRNDGDGIKTVIDSVETERAQQVSKTMRRQWDDWVDQTPDVREELAHIYNSKVNVWADRPVTAPAAIDFPGKVDDSIIELRGHQSNYVWTSILKRACGAIHDTGAGKTYAQIAASMKLRSLGVTKKPLFVVPNHLVGQWAEAFTALFPSAKVLAPGTKGFEAGNRARLFGQISTGDWDAIIIGDSQLQRLPIDYEIAERIHRDEVAAIQSSMLQLDESLDRITVKRLEQRLAKLEAQHEALTAQLDRDGGVTWNMLGIDHLIVDELQRFKNLGYSTSLQVAGLGDTQGSNKAYDLFIKTRAMELTGKRFSPLTATPIANTIAELYTYQRYTMYEEMVRLGTHHFDAWVNQFGNVTSTYELDATGVNYKQVDRLATFKNMPELMAQYRNVSHVVTLEDIKKDFDAQGKPWIFPEIEGGAPQNIVVPRTELQGLYMELLIDRAEAIEAGAVEPTDDNKLVVTTDARKAAIDMRLIDDSYSDPGHTKLDETISRTFETYKKWDALKGTQLLFCDFGIPKGAIAGEKARLEELMEQAKSEDESLATKAARELEKYSEDEISSILDTNTFSVYDEIKEQLILKGVNPEHIAFIHDAKNERQKERLFERMRSGDLRILLGSTSKLGEGTNVQDRLVALRNIDCPWRPDQMKQRIGRIVRQGNLFLKSNPEFKVIVENMATEHTYDARMYMLNKTKAIMLGQVSTGRLSDRVVDDITPEAASAAEMTAAASGNPLILREFALKREVKDKDAEYREALNQHSSYHRSIKQAQLKLERALRTHELTGSIADEFSAYPSEVLVKKADNKKTHMAAVPFVSNRDGKIESASRAAGSIITSLLEQKRDQKLGHKVDYELGRFGSLTLVSDDDGLWNSDSMCLSVISDSGETIASTSSFELSDVTPKGLLPRLVSLRNGLAEIDRHSERQVHTCKKVLQELSARPEPADPSPILNELRELEDEHQKVLDKLTNGADYRTATMAEVDQAFSELEVLRSENEHIDGVEDRYSRAFSNLKNKYLLYLSRENGEEIDEAKLPSVKEVQGAVRSLEVLIKLHNAKEKAPGPCETLTISDVLDDGNSPHRSISQVNDEVLEGPTP